MINCTRAGAGRRSGPECLIGRPESSARISEARSEFNGGGEGRPDRPWWPGNRSGAKMLAVRRVKAGAIAPPRQHAILGFAHIGDAHGKPNSNRHQGDRECDGRDIRQHAMTEVVRFIPGPFIARQVVRLGARAVRLGLSARVTLPARRADRVARPELEHPMLFFRRNGPLGFHCCQSRDILILSSTLATPLTENVGGERR
jgi:hypothetical protein